MVNDGFRCVEEELVICQSEESYACLVFTALDLPNLVVSCTAEIRPTDCLTSIICDEG